MSVDAGFEDDAGLATSVKNENERPLDSDTTTKERPIVTYKVECQDPDGRQRWFESEKPFPLDSASKNRDVEMSLSDNEPSIEIITTIKARIPRVYVEISDGGLVDQSRPETPILDSSVEAFRELSIIGIKSTTIVILSEQLRDAIRGCVKYHPSMNWSGDVSEIIEPFTVLVHHFEDLQGLQPQQEPGSRLARELHVLLEYVREFMQPHIEKVRKKLRSPTASIAHKDLWILFRPGQEIYWRAKFEHFTDIRQSGIIQRAEFDMIDIYGRHEKDFSMHAWSLQYDGEFLGRNQDSITISPYQNEQPVTSLPVYPCYYSDSMDGGKTRRELIERGRLVFRLLKEMPGLKSYDGLAYDGQKGQYAGPLMTDTGYFSTEHDRLAFKDSNEYPFLLNELTAHSYESDMAGIPLSSFHFKDFHHIDISQIEELSSETHYFLMTALIGGFGLYDKIWRVFRVDLLADVQQREAMDDLIINPDNRTFVEAIVCTQAQPFQIDSMDNKGEGQVVLLHGSPGVGKTYTVECIAQTTGRPLISLSMGNLVHEEEEVETALTKWFNLAERWKAILLLDEADIFLERRATRDIERNGIVSVLLRKLEYFSGLLFLTTNRVGQIDDAFISRASVVLQYDRLSDNTRRKIWEGFFRKLEKEAALPNGRKIEVDKYARKYVLNDDEIRSLEWNGREIRNALHTAVSLATHRAMKDGKDSGQVVELEEEDFRKVANMSRKFKEYLYSITKRDEDGRAAAKYDRPPIIDA